LQAWREWLTERSFGDYTGGTPRVASASRAALAGAAGLLRRIEGVVDFERVGWPFAALHPDAPRGIGAVWHGRLFPLVEMFGAQHIANAVATTFLTPWSSVTFSERLRLPSRPRMLAELNVRNVGDAAWTTLCKRIEVHAWI